MNSELPFDLNNLNDTCSVFGFGETIDSELEAMVDNATRAVGIHNMSSMAHEEHGIELNSTSYDTAAHSQYFLQSRMNRPYAPGAQSAQLVQTNQFSPSNMGSMAEVKNGSNICTWNYESAAQSQYVNQQSLSGAPWAHSAPLVQTNQPGPSNKVLPPIEYTTQPMFPVTQMSYFAHMNPRMAPIDQLTMITKIPQSTSLDITKLVSLDPNQMIQLANQLPLPVPQDGKSIGEVYEEYLQRLHICKFIDNQIILELVFFRDQARFRVRHTTTRHGDPDVEFYRTKAKHHRKLLEEMMPKHLELLEEFRLWKEANTALLRELGVIVLDELPTMAEWRHEMELSAIALQINLWFAPEICEPNPNNIYYPRFQAVLLGQDGEVPELLNAIDFMNRESRVLGLGLEADQAHKSAPYSIDDDGVFKKPFPGRPKYRRRDQKRSAKVRKAPNGDQEEPKAI